MSSDSCGFWAHGAEIHAKTLAKERNERVAELRCRFEKATSDAAKAQLVDELKQVRKYYKGKTAELPRVLF